MGVELTRPRPRPRPLDQIDVASVEQVRFEMKIVGIEPSVWKEEN